MYGSISCWDRQFSTDLILGIASISNKKKAISGWLISSYIAMPKGGGTGCAAALGTEFVWKEIKILRNKKILVFVVLFFLIHATRIISEVPL